MAQNDPKPQNPKTPCDLNLNRKCLCIKKNINRHLLDVRFEFHMFITRLKNRIIHGDPYGKEELPMYQPTSTNEEKKEPMVGSSEFEALYGL